jgi:hypothetical protein
MSRERAMRRLWITAARSSRLDDAPMPIVVFWIQTTGVPAHRRFGDAERRRQDDETRYCARCSRSSRS